MKDLFISFLEEKIIPQIEITEVVLRHGKFEAMVAIRSELELSYYADDLESGVNELTTRLLNAYSIKPEFESYLKDNDYSGGLMDLVANDVRSYLNGTGGSVPLAEVKELIRQKLVEERSSDKVKDMLRKLIEKNFAALFYDESPRSRSCNSHG